jgi:hypothetical protein
MGGFGSGRSGGADCTSDYRSIDARRWQWEIFFTLGQNFSCNWFRYGEKVADINVQVEHYQLN